jgi:hypothetical protein
VTIAGGILCPDGIVLCADTQETIGTFKRQVPKLVELPLVSPDVRAVAVGSTDDAVFLDGLLEKLSSEIDLTDGHLAQVRDAIEDTVLKYCSKVWPLYTTPESRPLAHLLLGLKTIDGLSLLEVLTPNVRNIPKFEFVGDGKDIANYKAKHFFTAVMPAEVAAGVLAFILAVVKDNNVFCGGPTQMAVIRSDGSISHKDDEEIKRIAATLTWWDYYSNRLGAIFPFIHINGKPALEYLGSVDAKSDFLNDKNLERVLFGLFSRFSGNADGPVAISIEDWAAQVGHVARGALNAKDVAVFDEIAKAAKTIEDFSTRFNPGTIDSELKLSLNAFINAYNRALVVCKQWRVLVEQHQEAVADTNSMELALGELRTTRNNLRDVSSRVLGIQEPLELETPENKSLALMLNTFAQSVLLLQQAEIPLHDASIVGDEEHTRFMLAVKEMAYMGQQANEAMARGDIEAVNRHLASAISRISPKQLGS